MHRRAFLSTAACAALPVAAAAPTRIIDTHIHLFDPGRPQGIPWPPKDNKLLYQPALPDRYQKLAAPHGVVGAIEVEASPWVEDNQWVLDVIEKNPIMLGTIGNLEAGTPAFAGQLERFSRNKRFLGIRYGNLWNRDFHALVARPAFLSDIKRLAAAGLTLDTANPNPALVADLVRLTDAVPGLRLVIDHLPQLTPPAAGPALDAYHADLRKLAANPGVYVKVSEVLRRVDNRVPLELSFYRDRLDLFYGTFGPDRLVYGSDWPNSDNWAPYGAVIGIVKEYFNSKGAAAAEKYFYTNSQAAYRWQPRK